MKIGLPLKLGVGVVVFFGLLLGGLFLWTPVRVRWYLGKLNSTNAEERVEGVTGLIAIGKRGREALAKKLSGGEAAADFLIKHWAKPNKVDAQDILGNYPLHLAAEKGYPTVAELLIAKGAEVDTKAILALTPLHRSAACGQKLVAELLITKGAEINAKDNVGRTPLHQAAAFGQESLVELLIAKGAVVNAKDNEGKTPLHKAAICGRKAKALAELLIAKGADVNAKGNDGRTPLHWAAIGGRKAIAELLIAKGADVNAKDKGGSTPLDSAIYAHQRELVAGRPMDMTLVGNLKKVIELLRAHGGERGRGE